MQVALIAPKSMLEWTKKGDMHFIIPLTADVRFYAKEKKYKIFDNGVYESGQALDFETFVRLAKKLKVDEIIIPDVMFDERATYNQAVDFCTCYDLPVQSMIVPQAENPAGWIDAYKLFTRTFAVDIIGVPKWLDGKFHSRAAVLNYLARKGQIDTRPHHLLGVDSLSDLLCLQPEVRQRVRSCDTSKPFTFAYAKRELSIWSQEELPRVKFDIPELIDTGVSYRLLEHNINILMEAAHWHDSI